MSSDAIPPGNSPPLAKLGSGSRKPGKRRGRPKGSRNVKTIVQSNAREKHTVRKGDERIQLTTVELLFRLLLAEAMKGNIQAEKLIDHYLERQRLPTDNLAYFIVPESLSPDEFERQIKIRNSLRLREALADVLLENRLLKKSILLDPEAAGNCRSARAD